MVKLPGLTALPLFVLERKPTMDRSSCLFPFCFGAGEDERAALEAAVPRVTKSVEMLLLRTSFRLSLRASFLLLLRMLLLLLL